MEKEEIINKLTTFPNTWNYYLKDEKNKGYFKKLVGFLVEEYQNKIIYPKINDIYNAFKYVNLEDIKLIIFGQDPYYSPNYANGLAFSVSKEIKKLPKSLVNIYKEIEIEYGKKPSDGDLTYLAKQGVLLLNTCLSVEKDKPLSHSNIGWEIFINNVINLIEEKRDNVVYLLFGNKAKEKEKLIQNKKNIIKTAHPSPLSASRGFFYSNCFINVNKRIKEIYDTEIIFSV